MVCLFVALHMRARDIRVCRQLARAFLFLQNIARAVMPLTSVAGEDGGTLDLPERKTISLRKGACCCNVSLIV